MQDYYPYEDYTPPPLWRRILWLSPWLLNFVAWILFIWACICLITYASADTCAPLQTTCAEPTTVLDMCTGEFPVTEILTKYVTTCDSKLRRFIDTNTTPEAKNRFFCKCLWQAQLWDRRDP